MGWADRKASRQHTHTHTQVVLISFTSRVCLPLLNYEADSVLGLAKAKRNTGLNTARHHPRPLRSQDSVGRLQKAENCAADFDFKSAIHNKDVWDA